MKAEELCERIDGLSQGLVSDLQENETYRQMLSDVGSDGFDKELDYINRVHSMFGKLQEPDRTAMAPLRVELCSQHALLKYLAGLENVAQCLRTRSSFIATLIYGELERMVKEGIEE